MFPGQASSRYGALSALRAGSHSPAHTRGPTPGLEYQWRPCVRAGPPAGVEPSARGDRARPHHMPSFLKAKKVFRVPENRQGGAPRVHTAVPSHQAQRHRRYAEPLARVVMAVSVVPVVSSRVALLLWLLLFLHHLLLNHLLWLLLFLHHRHGVVGTIRHTRHRIRVSG